MYDTYCVAIRDDSIKPVPIHTENTNVGAGLSANKIPLQNQPIKTRPPHSNDPRCYRFLRIRLPLPLFGCPGSSDELGDRTHQNRRR
jgi:hypothetical protein